MWAPDASAHALGEDYIFLNVREGSLDGRFEVNFQDLNKKWGMDVGGDPQAVVDASAERVEAYIRERFAIRAGERVLPLTFAERKVLELPQGTFGQYFFRSESGPVPDVLQFEHNLFYEVGKRHRGFLMIEYNEKTKRDYGREHLALIFEHKERVQDLDLTAVPQISLMRPRDMIWQGILHIWIGIDHILFLLALILPAVLRREEGRWAPVAGFRPALWNILKIVTVFTVAHSLTLALAALEIVKVPSRLVESVIALSIVLVAANNIFGVVREGSLWIILGLGLFHGLGFASVMGHLPFHMEQLAKVIIGFNIGVELGQVAIVSLAFPLLFLLRKQKLYVPLILKGGSLILAVIAAVWFVQRAFGLD